MKFATKRASTNSPQDAQAGNRSWWTSHQMSYDWKDKIGAEQFSAAWFDEADARFLSGARLFSTAANPFHGLMDTAGIAGQRVLEIGCGMGLHAEMLATAGAHLTAVDISDVSIAATQRRFNLKHLSGDLLRVDAETLPFADASFDLVWSWGVIHHSARTGRIVREIARVLKPGGTAKLMVYNLGGAAAYATLLLRYSWEFWLKRRSLDEVLWASSDGFMARFYTIDGFTDCLATFFDRVDIQVFGQEADAIPLPRAWRGRVRGLFADAALRRLAAQRGSFLFATASN